LGIGTTSPGQALAVESSSVGVTRVSITNTGNAAAGAGVQFITKNGATQVSNATVRTDNAGNFSIFTGTTSETERMRIDSSGNLRVGVGNTFEPVMQFTNSGRVEGNPGFTFNGDLDTGMFNPSAQGTIAFSNNGSESMRIDSSGNVGIGRTPTIVESAYDSIQLGAGGTFLSGSSNLGAGNFGQNYYVDTSGNTKYLGNDEAERIVMNNGYISFENAPTNTSGAGAALTFNECMRIDSSGNVGIGTSSPRVELNVQNGSNASSYTGVGPGDIIRASGNGSGNWIASEDDGAMAYFGIDAGQGKFAAYNYATTTEMNVILGQDRMFIENNGKVGIGSTNPNSILHIISSLNDTWVDVNGPASQYTGLKLFRGNGDWASIAHNHFGLLVSDLGLEISKFTGSNATGRTQIMVFDGANGHVGIGTGTSSLVSGASSLTTLNVNGSIMTLNALNGAGRHYIYEQRYSGSNNLTLGYVANGTSHTAGFISSQNNLPLYVGVGNNDNIVLTSDGNAQIQGNLKVDDQIRIKADNNYLEVDQTTAINLQFYLTGYHMGGIRRIGSDNGGSFRPNQYSTGATAAQYPAHAEWDDENTGVYFPGADQVGLTAGGTVKILARTPASGSNTMLSINTDGYANAGQINHYLGAGNGDNGGYRMFSGSFSEIINCVQNSTAAGSLRYWHIKTNIATNENIMFKATARGYAYGNSGHDIHVTRTGYMYQPTGSVITTVATNHGSGSHTIDYYNSSDNYLVFVVDFVGSYYTGATFDIMFPSPAGYEKDFKVQAHTMNANSSGVY